MSHFRANGDASFFIGHPIQCVQEIILVSMDRKVLIGGPVSIAENNQAGLRRDVIRCPRDIAGNHQTNPPYVEESFADQMQKDVRDYEPHLALFAPEDGLSLIRRIIGEAPPYLKPGGLLAFEIGAGQSARVQSLWGKAWKEPGIIKDLSGHDRTVYAEYQGI